MLLLIPICRSMLTLLSLEEWRSMTCKEIWPDSLSSTIVEEGLLALLLTLSISWSLQLTQTTLSLSHPHLVPITVQLITPLEIVLAIPALPLSITLACVLLLFTLMEPPVHAKMVTIMSMKLNAQNAMSCAIVVRVRESVIVTATVPFSSLLSSWQCWSL